MIASLVSTAYVLTALMFDPLTGENAGRAFLVETREQCAEIAEALDAHAAEAGLAVIVRCDDVATFQVPASGV